MNCKPPISQKLSPITIKSHIKATKPKYYSPKTKPTESFTPNTNNFTTYVTPYLSPSKITSLHEKQLKKSGSNEYFNPNTVKPSYFDFKQQKILDINDKNEIDQAFITTLRSLRKEIKPYKSEGELKAYNLNKPIEKDLIKGSIYHKNLIRDDINGPTFLGLEPKPNKPFSGFQSSVLDRCLPKFSHNMNIKMKPRIDYSNNLIKKNDYNEKFEYSIKKPEYVESFVNVISNDSDLKVKPIKNIEFSANPFNQSILFKNNNNFNKKNNWRIEDFDLGKCLGKGKFGKVFIAREKKTRCLFAIKCILKKGLGGGNLEQMVREIKIHSFLQHVNVVQFFGCFEDGVKVYLILELALQGNLFTELRKQANQRFEENVAAGFLKQTLEAVKYLHSNYIIHRDIKPENILVSNGILKLADFGWSIYAPEENRTTFCGTVDYVAPEILSGSHYDAKVDLWSLGVLCFELVTGKAPFENRVNREAFKNIINLNFKFPEYLTETTKDFINRLLVKDPVRRYNINEISTHPFLAKADGFNPENMEKNIKFFKETF